MARYNGPADWHDGIFDLQLDADGNVYVIGYSYATSSGYDWAIIKYNSAGLQQWLVRYNGPGNAEDCPYEMALDQAANLYITGYYTGKGNNYDFLTAKFNSAGVKQWAYHYNATANKDDISNDLVLDHAGNVCVTGKSQNPDGNSGYLTIKFNNAGTRQWIARHKWIARHNRTDRSYARALDVAVNSENDIYVTGRTFGTNSGDDWATIKYNSAGVKAGIAHHSSRGFKSDIPCKILVDSDDNVYVAGNSYYGVTFGCMDYLVISYSKYLGTNHWMVYDGPSHLSDMPYDMALGAGGNIYITGVSHGATTGADILTVKYYVRPFNKASAAEEHNSAAVRNGELPTVFELMQNFPNPFNRSTERSRRSPSTTISFALPTVSRVKLAIYNLNGKLLHILADGEMNAGYHHLNFDASRLASGVYFYRLDAGAYSATRKMILQK